MSKFLFSLLVKGKKHTHTQVTTNGRKIQRTDTFIDQEF